MRFFYNGITNYQIKLLGTVLMFLDHFYQLFSYSKAPIIFYMLGRIVFPIFLFMLVEGYSKTSNRKKYIIRLLISFWIMNIIIVILNNVFPMSILKIENNIFGTLFLSTIIMYSIDEINRKNLKIGTIILSLPLLLYIIIFLLEQLNPSISKAIYYIIPTYFTVEGGAFYLLLIGFVYQFKENKTLQYSSLILFSFLSLNFNFQNLFTSNIQWMMIFSIIPISLYNGKRGKNSKYFFYIFYPVHLIALYILSYYYGNYILKIVI